MNKKKFGNLTDMFKDLGGEAKRDIMTSLDKTVRTDYVNDTQYINKYLRCPVSRKVLEVCEEGKSYQYFLHGPVNSIESNKLVKEDFQKTELFGSKGVTNYIWAMDDVVYRERLDHWKPKYRMSTLTSIRTEIPIIASPNQKTWKGAIYDRLGNGGRIFFESEDGFNKAFEVLKQFKSDIEKTKER